MKTLNTLTFLAITFCNSFFSQKDLAIPNTRIDGISQWGNGTIVCNFPNSSVLPKSRTFNYFDETGKMLWEKEIKPFNYTNKFIASKESKYAYFVNLSFLKTAAAESSDHDSPIRINRIDMQGNVKEMIISMSSLSPLIKKDLNSLQFACISGDKLNLLFEVKNPIDKKSRSYALIQIDVDGKCKVQKMDNLTIKEENWSNVASSSPVYITNDSKNIIFMNTNRYESTLEFNITILDANTLKPSKEIKATMPYTKLPGLFASAGEASYSETQGVSYNTWWTTMKGNTTYSTLEAFTTPKLLGSTLLLAGNSSLSKENIIGLWNIKVDLKGENVQNLEPEIIDLSKFPSFEVTKANTTRSLVSFNIDLNEDGETTYYLEGRDFKYFVIDKLKIKALEASNMGSISILANPKALSELKKSGIKDPVMYVHKNSEESIFYVLNGKTVKVLKY